MLSNFGAGEDSWEFLGLQRDQTSLKEINPEYSSEGLMLKLKRQHFGHLIQRAHSLEKTLMLEKIEGRRRRGWQRKRWLNGINNSMDMSLGELREIVKDRKSGVLQSMGSQRVGHDWVTEQQHNGYYFTFIHKIYYTRQGAGATEMRRHGLCPKKIQFTVGNTVAWKGMESTWRIYSWEGVEYNREGIKEKGQE